MKNRTRELLLDSGFKEFYKNGYQGASVATILQEVGINKGSMYHFFKSKKVLALGVIRERIYPNLELKYRKILEDDNSFVLLFETLQAAVDTLPYGCPLNKMSQEMVYLDRDFYEELSKVYLMFEALVEKILIKAQKEKIISPADTLTMARLIISTYEGALMMYHLNRDKSIFESVITDLQNRL